MGNCFQKETKDEVKNEAVFDPNDPESIKLYIENIQKENRRLEKEVMSEFNKLNEKDRQLEEILIQRWGYSSIPRRRIRLIKSASKRKSNKTRSEHAKKKKVSRKTRKY